MEQPSDIYTQASFFTPFICEHLRTGVQFLASASFCPADATKEEDKAETERSSHLSSSYKRVWVGETRARTSRQVPVRSDLKVFTDNRVMVVVRDYACAILPFLFKAAFNVFTNIHPVYARCRLVVDNPHTLIAGRARTHQQ